MAIIRSDQAAFLEPVGLYFIFHTRSNHYRKSFYISAYFELNGHQFSRFFIKRIERHFYSVHRDPKNSLAIAANLSKPGF